MAEKNNRGGYIDNEEQKGFLLQWSTEEASELEPLTTARQ